MKSSLPNALIQELVEQSLAGIYVIQDGNLPYINQHFADIFGYDSPENIINIKTFTDLVYPEDQSLVISNIQLRAQGIVNQIRYRFRGVRKDNSILHVEVHGQQSIYNGKPAIIGILIDHTQQVLAEQRLKQEEKKVSALFDANLIGIIRWDENGYIRYANDTFKEMIGLTQAAIDEGLHWHAITPGEYFYSCLEHIKQILSTGKGSALQKEFLHKDGHRVPVVVNGTRLEDSDEIGISFILDLTSTKSAEAMLEQQNIKFGYLFDSNLIAIARVQESGHVIEHNDAFTDMLGYTREEFSASSMCLWDFQPPESKAISHKARKETDQNGTLSPKEITFTHKNGHPVNVIVGAALVSAPDTLKVETPGAIIYLVDITEQKSLKELTENQQDLL